MQTGEVKVLTETLSVWNFEGREKPDCCSSFFEASLRYASKKSSHDTEYASYLKDYAGNEKGQDGEKYMAGTGSDYQHFSDYSDYQHFTDTSNRAPSTLSYQTYMRAGSSSGSAKWNEQYGYPCLKGKGV